MYNIAETYYTKFNFVPKPRSRLRGQHRYYVSSGKNSVHWEVSRKMEQQPL